MKKTYRQFPVLRKQIIIDEATEKKKKTLEKQVFFLMAAIYCQDFHEFIKPKTAASELEFSQEIEAWLRRNRRMSNYQLCHDCYKRIQKSFQHTQKCPHSVYKTFCHECPTMCYREEDQKNMLPIMHYSSKKLIKKHPIYAFRFVKNLLANKSIIKKNEVRKMKIGRWKAFTIKDIVFLAVITAVTLLVSGPVAPIVMTVTKLGAQAFAMALPFALITSIGLRKVKKNGSLTIIGVFSGLVLGLMSPVMFFNQLAGSVLSEGLALILFKNYENKKAVLFSAGLFSFFTIPTTGIINILAKGRAISEQIGNVFTFLLFVLGAVALGLIGAAIGNIISDELQKAGKL